jgi:hypothetical protein
MLQCIVGGVIQRLVWSELQANISTTLVIPRLQPAQGPRRSPWLHVAFSGKGDSARRTTR